MTTTTMVTQEQLAEVVGDMAAFMIFGQGAACVGRTFSLRPIRGRGRVTVRVTAEGVYVAE